MSVCATLAKLEAVCDVLSIAAERSAVELAVLDSWDSQQLQTVSDEVMVALFARSAAPQELPHPEFGVASTWHGQS